MIVQCGSCQVSTTGGHEVGCPNAPRPPMSMSSNIYRCGCPHCKGHAVGANTTIYTLNFPDLPTNVQHDHQERVPAPQGPFGA